MNPGPQKVKQAANPLVRVCLQKHPDWSVRKWAGELGVKKSTYQNFVDNLESDSLSMHEAFADYMGISLDDWVREYRESIATEYGITMSLTEVNH